MTENPAPVEFDLVIRGGRVIDPETNLDAIRDVGVIAAKIAAVSETPLTGKTMLEATGQVVAPGFIDLHSHGWTLPGAWMQAFDGVTTHLELEAGTLPIGVAYDNVAAEGRPINYGFGSGWMMARMAVLTGDVVGQPNGTLLYVANAYAHMEWAYNYPTDDQLKQVMNLVEEGLNEGALVVSLVPGYLPATGHKEFYDLAVLAAKHGVATVSHDRYMAIKDPQSSFEALIEHIGVAAATGAHMHLCHINSLAGRDLLAAVDLVKGAQARGVKITTESYTYGAFSTSAGAAYLKGPDWLARFGSTDYADFEFNGQGLSEEQIVELQKASPGAPIVFHLLDEENAHDMELLDLAVTFPGGAIASDCMPWAIDGTHVVEGDVWPLPDKAFAHPRSAGCFSRVFATWVRERQKLTLVEAIAKCSLIPAQILQDSVPQLASKGRLQVGCDADIVVFDPATVQDHATYTQPAQVSTGFAHVVVNGIPIIENGERQGDRRPGQAIRRSV